jgi:hypothetical protein
VKNYGRAMVSVLALVAIGAGAWLAFQPPQAVASVEPALEDAVLQADKGVLTDTDALDAARLLEAAIRAKPERSLDLAKLLPRLKNRALAFRLALILGREVHKEPMRASLLESVEHGANHAREVAAYAFYGKKGDAQAAAALARGFLDPKSDARVRAAHAFATSSLIADLDEVTRAAVRAQARAVAGAQDADAALRAEAIGLLDVNGADRDFALGILEKDPTRTVVFSAARVLLRAGEDEGRVREAMSRFASRADDADLTAKCLAEMLEGPGGGL